MKTLFRPLLFVTLLIVALTARAEELAIIAKARGRVGTEAALASVKAVHYTGSLLVVDGSTQPTPIKIDIVFAYPDRQRVMATYDKGIEWTVLDGYVAWQKTQDNADPSRWRLTLLAKEQVKRLRANTWENLSFFRGIEKVYGTARDDGAVTLDGVACEKVAFIHEPDIIFYRYFDQATGRLVLTETETGSKIREEGEIIVSGVRFPKKIVTTSTAKDGKVQAVTLSFDQITLNETFADSIFAVPEIPH